MATTVGSRLAPPSGSLHSSSPMSMRLLATMDVDGTSPNCVPRLCTLKITRLSVTRVLDAEPSSSSSSSSFILAVKMQGTRRVLRSNEIPVDAELDITFELAYPHYLKRDGNKLQIMLQRRKRYRSRPVMGFKTLAVGAVNMAHVLQRSAEPGRLIQLIETKEGSEAVAEVTLGALTTQPLEDHDQGGRSGSRRSKLQEIAVDRSPDNDSDDDFLEDDFDDQFGAEGGSDSEGPTGTGPDYEERPRTSKRRSKMGQRNLKQRFVALLRKFKVNEEVLASGHDNDDPEIRSIKNQEIEDIFNELEECYHTDSDEDDRSIMSVLSTPKPTLRPFFAPVSGLSRSQDILPVVTSPVQASDISEDPSSSHTIVGRQDSDPHQENLTDHETSSDGAAGQYAAGAASAAAIASSHAQDSNVIATSSYGANVSSGANASALSLTNGAGHLTNGSGVGAAQTHIASPPKPASNAHDVAKENRKSPPPVAKSGRSRPPSMKMEGKRQSSKDGFDVKSNLSRKDSQGRGEGSPRKALLDHLSTILGDRDSGVDSSIGDLNASTTSSSSLSSSLASSSNVATTTTTTTIPDKLFMVSANEFPHANVLTELLQERNLKVVTTSSSADVKATLVHLVARIQKFCHSHSRSPQPVRILLIGSDSYVTSVLRPYIQELSSKPPDWQGYIRFLIVSVKPNSWNPISKHLSTIDSSYRSLFDDQFWRDNIERIDSLPKDVQEEIVSRLLQYIKGADATLQLPVAEAMLTLREKTAEDDSTQVNVPFVGDVRLGSYDASFPLDPSLDEGSVDVPASTPLPGVNATPTSGIVSGSPPSSSASFIANLMGGKEAEKEREKRGGEEKEWRKGEEEKRRSGINFHFETVVPDPFGSSSSGGGVGGPLPTGVAQAGIATPPSSPSLIHQNSGAFTAFHDKNQTLNSTATSAAAASSPSEVMELQVDYWTPLAKQESSQSLTTSSDKEEREKEEKRKREKTEKAGKGEGESPAAGTVGKNTLKGHVRFLQVSRLPSGCVTSLLSMIIVTKEKKTKMMRIGKKSKENSEGKSQTMEGITRLICSATKTHNIKVCIDGVEWPGVKFFQLASQWNSQIKHFPVLVFSSALQMAPQMAPQVSSSSPLNQGNRTSFMESSIFSNL